jgi:hypothetical protein
VWPARRRRDFTRHQAQSLSAAAAARWHRSCCNEGKAHRARHRRAVPAMVDRDAPRRPSRRHRTVSRCVPACRVPCGFLRLALVHLPGGRGSTGIIVPIEILALAAVSEPDFKAAAVGDALGIMRDDANAIGHPGMIPLSGPTGKRLEIVGRARSHPRGVVLANPAGVFAERAQGGQSWPIGILRLI